MSKEDRESSETLSSTSEETEIIPGYSSVEQFTKDGFKVLMEAIRHSNALPTGRDWNFYTVSDSFNKIINDESSSVLRLMNQIMRCNEIESNIRNRILDEKTELVVEANDVILEKVANNIDEMNGVRKTWPEPIVIQTVSAELPINGSWNRPSAATITVNPKSSQPLGQNCIKLITAKNIIRPQKFFKDKIDNNNKYPWYPKITDKPNSLKPLAIFLEESANGEEYSHPYEFELDRFAPTPEQLLGESADYPKNISETPLVEIDKPEQLDELVETLRSCKEFAVDLEHHSYRSFMGITCLLQISTKDRDYLIDTLALREKLCILNEVFTKNNIVKIFHGADKDIEWLQRDLSLYVVNMFDTHQAAKILQYPGLSLAFLMKKFCDILPNKQFQLADWRIRPLPDEFKAYAREDTHYLIYIYKMLKKELLQKGNKSDNLLKSAIERSTEICKKRYFKPILRGDSHMDLYRKCKKMFDNRQLYALKEVYAWRDNLAREEDESLAYVLPNHMLLQISETLPREMQGILASCNPIPPLVRSHLLELHQIILKAREQPLEKAILKEYTTGRGVLKKVSKVNVDSVLHCPHDLSKTNEYRDDLPTLLHNSQIKLDVKNFADIDLPIEKSSSYSIFDSSNSCDYETFNERITFKKLRGFAYFSPYERYKLVKPFVEEEEKAVEAQKREEEESKTKEKQVEETPKEGRSDDDRIASIRDHFLQLSKKFSEELEAKKLQEEEEEATEKARSLVEMGGSRKRKRDWGTENDGLPHNYQDIDFQTPLPNIKQNRKKYMQQGKKRKFNEISHSFDNQEEQIDDQNRSQHFCKKRKKNRQQKQQQQQGNQNQVDQQRKAQNRQQQKQQQQGQNRQQQKQQQQGSQKQVNQSWKGHNRQQQKQQQQGIQNQVNQQRKAQNRQQQKQQQQGQNRQQQKQQQQGRQYQVNQQRKCQNPEQRQQGSQHQINHQQKGQNRFKQNFKKQKNKNRNAGQQDNPAYQQNAGNGNFVPYDYASVDFRQFQGGAGSATGAVNIKSNLKAKGRKKMGNKGARSATFNNFNSNRGKAPGKNG